MIKELNENTALKLKSLNEEEKKAKGVLGRLYGPVASFAAPTRNGRKYTQDLWEKLFESDLIKERFANGGIFGQLCHPDYSEVDMEKIACVMPEPPVKDKNGNLIAYVDLIDTPCGRIAYQLAKYGYKFGISSRGEGDLIDGPDGEEVDPDTYQLNAFDLVEIPAVENARLAFTESLDKKRYNKTLRETLQESIDKASDEDKEIMTEALDNLGIKLEEEIEYDDKVANQFKDEFDIASKEECEKEFKEGFLDKEDRYKDWDPEDAELHRNTDWKARNYEDLPVPEDSFEDDVVMYRHNAEPEHKNVKFIKRLRSNPIFPPYYAPEEEPFEHSVGSMYNGRRHGNYDIHDRYEDQETYDRMFESREQCRERLISKLRDSQEVDESLLQDLNSDRQWFIDEYGEDAYNAYTKYAEENPEVYNNLYGESNIKKFLSQYNEECNNESCSDKNDAEEVVNDKSSELVAEFQEALLKIKELEDDNLSLQEKLSVCNAKENQLQEQLNKYKQATINLSESAKQAKSLNDDKAKLTENLNKQSEIASKNKARIDSLIETKKDLRAKLTEAQNKINELNDQVKVINEELESNSKQLESSKDTLAKYRKSYSALKESYLEVKAANYGLTKEEVKTNLKESYKVSDVDSVCEELHSKKSKLSKLPFVINENTNISVKKSSNEYIMNESVTSDDYISDSLLQLANLR